MRKYHQKVFDDFVQGTTAVYSDSQCEDKLGSTDFAVLGAVITDVTGTSVLLTISQEESPDRVHWVFADNTPINAELLASGESQVLGGPLLPGTAFMRLKIELAGTSAKAKIALYVTGRDFMTDGA